ncbi:MAG: guanylate kinase [Desulfobulbaceae bacterium]|nr:guanylate kinase [Desulfobulbaceae bacterium]
MITKGQLFILSGPSGSGKSTLMRQVLPNLPGLAFSVSHTTRQARPGERDGVHYHFVDSATFLALRDQQPPGFLEWAEVHGNLYGTSVAEIEEKIRQGVDILLDIDVQGARQVLRQRSDVVSIFLCPPSLEVMAERLRRRATEAESSFDLRLENARKELACASEYTYLLVNDRLETAVEGFRSIIIAERLRHRRNPDGQTVHLLR